ncbi:abc transporter atp-binding protein [Fragilaria crotonensis]|nr:abc transporter atp-binding protein [Fragilaria crotonensis]
MAATTTTAEASSSNVVGRIPPPPPVVVLKVDNSDSKRLPPPPPPPPRDDDDDDRKQESDLDKTKVKTETPTIVVGDHDLALTTTAEVDPILERFQRIVGNKHVQQQEKLLHVPDQPPFSKQDAARQEDAEEHELQRRPLDASMSLESEHRQEELPRLDTEVHVDSNRLEEDDGRLRHGGESTVFTTTMLSTPVVPPPPPPPPPRPLPPPQMQLPDPPTELRVPPLGVLPPESLHHGVIPQQQQQQQQSQFHEYQQFRQPPSQTYGLQHQHQHQHIPLRTQQVPPPRYRQQPLPRQQLRQHPSSSQSTIAPIWKSLWNRVEQGLDSLAFVEEKVAERTNQWTHQVTHKAREILPTSLLPSSTKPTKVVSHSVVSTASSAKPNQPLRRPEAPDSHIAGILGGRKFAALTRQQPSTTTAATNTAATSQQVSASLASLYAMPEAEGNADDSDNEEEDRDIPVRANNSWEPRPILRAGASEANPAASMLAGSRTAIPPLATARPPNMDQAQSGSGEETRKRPFAMQTEQLQHMPRPSQPVRPLYDRVEDSNSFWSRVPLPSLPRLPSVVSKFLGRGSGSYRAMAAATMDAWKDEDQTSRRWSAAKRQKEVKAAVPKGTEPSSSSSSSSSMPPLTDLLVRCHNGESTALLSHPEVRKSRAIGRNKAILDLLCLGSVVHGVRELVSVSSRTGLQDSGNDIVAATASIFVEASRGWALYALSVAILTAATNHVIFDSQIRGLTNAVGTTVHGASRYSQLYMRLVAGQPVEKQVPNRMRQASEAQVLELIQTGRLQSFVSLVLSAMIIMTVSVIQPIVYAVLGSFFQFVTLPEFRSWPVPWAQVGSYLKDILVALSANINELLAVQFSSFKDSPVAFVFQLAFFGSLAAVAVLPSLAGHRKVRSLDDDEKEDEDVSASAFGTVTTLSNLGVSSASRLGLLSKSGALEGTGTMASHVAPAIHTAQCPFPAILAPTSWIHSIVNPTSVGTRLYNFVKVLNEVVEEVSGSQKRPEPLLGTSISPTIGLSVRDLWAAHTSKRAWAVRGASFDCHNGEIVAILGDDGEGKSRLLTAIAEALVNPAKRSLTTTKVRGSVSICGLDSMKWDRDQLKKRLGLFLNDVRTIADNAEFMSGFTLEEILEPMDGLLNQNPTAGARAANQALQITGLATSLVAQLPGKLSTVVTANENDLMPSALRPRCHALSPSEWSKLLLARVLAQTIFDNDNVSGAPLVGSLLLLDDLMTYLSEVDELKLLAALRRTGAATVFTSHKWASGRLADRIVVVKDGAVVESGTHNELLARGPQQSMYASKWHAMTTGG